MGRRTLQQAPMEVNGRATDYMHLIHYLVVGVNCDRRFIINMDRGSAHKKISMELIIGGKSQNLVWLLLLKFFSCASPTLLIFSLWESGTGTAQLLQKSNSFFFSNSATTSCSPNQPMHEMLEPLLVPLSNCFVPTSGLLRLMMG
jgi:hypothetical protein